MQFYFSILGPVLLRKNLDKNFLYDRHEKVHQFDQSIISLDCHVKENLLFALGVDKKTLYIAVCCKVKSAGFFPIANKNHFC